MKPKKKILNVVNVFFTVPFFFGDQFKHFKDKGYIINLICSPSSELELYSKKQGIESKEFIISRKFSIFQDIVSTYKIYKYIKYNNFDIVVGHTPKGALLSILASFLARTPKRIFFRHGLVYETKQGLSKHLMINIERITSLLATEVVCVSPYLVEKSITDYLSKPNKLKLLNIGSCNGVDVINKYNPINISQSKLLDYKLKYNLTNDDFVIGYVGRVVKDKGIPELVKSFIKLSESFHNLKLILIGPEEESDALDNFTATAINKNINIIVVGHIKEEIEYYYSLMNVFILPTLREGLGTVILEASSMCLPVLTNGYTGSKDAIINGVTGSYIDITTDSITQELEKYISNPVLCEKFGTQGRLHMIENFRQELIWDEIEKKLYQ